MTKEKYQSIIDVMEILNIPLDEVFRRLIKLNSIVYYPYYTSHSTDEGGNYDCNAYPGLNSGEIRCLKNIENEDLMEIIKTKGTHFEITVNYEYDEGIHFDTTLKCLKHEILIGRFDFFNIKNDSNELSVDQQEAFGNTIATSEKNQTKKNNIHMQKKIEMAKILIPFLDKKKPGYKFKNWTKFNVNGVATELFNSKCFGIDTQKAIGSRISKTIILPEYTQLVTEYNQDNSKI